MSGSGSTAAAGPSQHAAAPPRRNRAAFSAKDLFTAQRTLSLSLLFIAHANYYSEQSPQ